MQRKEWKKPKKNSREYLYWLLLAIHHRAEEEANGKYGFVNKHAVDVLNCLSTHAIFKIIRLTITELESKNRVLFEDEKDKIVAEE